MTLVSQCPSSSRFKTTSIRKKQLAVFSKNEDHVETAMQLTNALLLLIIFSSTLSPHPASFQFWQVLSNCLVILLNLLQDSLFFFFSIFQCLCNFFFLLNLLLRGYLLLQIVADKQVLMHEKNSICTEGRSSSVRALFLLVFIYKSSSSCSPLQFFFSFYCTCNNFHFSIPFMSQKMLFPPLSHLGFQAILYQPWLQESNCTSLC